MHPKNKEALRNRVIQATEVALQRQSYVSAIDVFQGMGVFTPDLVKKGRTALFGKSDPVEPEEGITVNCNEPNAIKSFSKEAFYQISRSRKQYERQGLLVEEQALKRAKNEHMAISD